MFALFATIGNIITTGFNRWGEVREAKHKVTLAKIEATAEVDKIEAQHTANWEIVQAQNSATSWKDEYLTLVFTAPFILAMFPPMRPYIADWFEFISGAPAWYQTCILIVVSASFGLRIFPHIGRMLNKRN